MGHSKDVQPRRALMGLTAGDATIPSRKFCSICPSDLLVTYVKLLNANIWKPDKEASFSRYIIDVVLPWLFFNQFQIYLMF
jgi:hypothetical protein